MAEVRDSEWHREKFTEFTKLKQEIGEPSPHLAIVGYLAKDKELLDRVWMIGCYGATYCLPSAQMIWENWGWRDAVTAPKELYGWLVENWPGIVTRTERRCVRTPEKMADCLDSYAKWVATGNFAVLQNALPGESAEDTYNRVWESVCSVMYIGRYIAIRMIEGMRRYCSVPAMLHDVRSMGGWSPRISLAWMFPNEPLILQDTKEGTVAADLAARELLVNVQAAVPTCNFYVLAAMLCEYRVAIEKGKQYPGWTLDQEPLLYDKARAYWGEKLDAAGLWEARAAIFPHEVLGEFGGWNGTRWDVAKVLRDFGYNWTDLKYDYLKTKAAGNWATPAERTT